MRDKEKFPAAFDSFEDKHMKTEPQSMGSSQVIKANTEEEKIEKEVKHKKTKTKLKEKLKTLLFKSKKDKSGKKSSDKVDTVLLDAAKPHITETQNNS